MKTTNEGARRIYRKSARAEAERATGNAILNAARDAFTSEAFDRVTLKQIAEQSGVTVQTVVRRFRSKEGVFQAFVERERPRILAARQSDPQDGLLTAIERLVDHYEEDGDLILNLVGQEQRFAAIAEIVAEGRSTHRRWVQTHCAHILAAAENHERERMCAAAFAATDLGTWKLLRRDLDHSREDVILIMSWLIAGLERRTR
jgi:AcrR family transcriptional regulator